MTIRELSGGLVVAAAPSATLRRAADWLLASGYWHLPGVGDNGSVIGIVSIRDVLWAVTGPGGEPWSR